MIDLEAIKQRHSCRSVDVPKLCEYCMGEWPCDAYRLADYADNLLQELMLAEL